MPQESTIRSSEPIQESSLIESQANIPEPEASVHEKNPHEAPEISYEEEVDSVTLCATHENDICECKKPRSAGFLRQVVYSIRKDELGQTYEWEDIEEMSRTGNYKQRVLAAA